MAGPRWERLAGFIGLVFVALIVGTFFAPSTPELSVADSTLAPTIAEDRQGIATGVYLLGLAAIAFVAFASGLFSRLRAAEGEHAGMSIVVVAGAVMFATMMLVSTGVTLALISAADENRNAAALRALFELDNVMFITSGFALALFLLSGAVSIVRTRALTPWIGWTGGALGVAMLVGSLGVLSTDDDGGPLGWVYFVALTITLLWVAAASLSLLRAAISTEAPWHRTAPAA